MASPDPPLLALPWRRFEGPDVDGRGFSVGGRSLVVKGISNSDEGTAHFTWDGAVLLAKYLEICEARGDSDAVRGKRVLELGSGTGLAGLAAAAMMAREVVLTDLEYALPNLQANIEATLQLWTLSGVESHPAISAAALDWEAQCPPNFDPVDVIIAADVVWLDSLVPPLVSILERLTFSAPTANGNAALAAPDEAATAGARGTTVLLAYQLRSNATKDLLLRLLAPEFIVKEVDANRHHPDYTAPEISILRLRRRQASGDGQA
ncbi:unnamed protein product [Phaeothamnion confervicola]